MLPCIFLQSQKFEKSTVVCHLGKDFAKRGGSPSFWDREKLYVC